jgi:glycine/D-amino acid oxidase-like deaminating enzyme
MSMFGTDFIRNLKAHTGDGAAPEITLKEFGYLFLAPAGKQHILAENHATQAACGAATELLSRDEIARRFPFYKLDDIELGSFNPVGEGWFDGYGLMQYLQARAIAVGVQKIQDEVIGLDVAGSRVSAVRLQSGERIACGCVINAAGPRAGRIASMAGLALPVEPRKRCLFLFDCREDLGQTLPLTIDPSGVHVRSEGKYYLTGTVPKPDHAVAFDDFEVDYGEFEDEIWAIIAARIPAFEAIKLVRGWAGHYAYNTFDHNAVLGAHPDIGNLYFANGYSGHGLQHSPAVGRGIAELILHGGYRTLDMRELGWARILENRPFLEQAII